MTDVTRFFVFNIPSIICLATGAYLCYKEKEGWGWFLFVGFLLFVSGSPDTVKELIR